MRLRDRLAALSLVLLAAACAPMGAPGACGPREITLRNASVLAVEQAYGGDGTPGGWDVDLLGQGDLPPGASRVLRIPGGTRAIRLVTGNGRAVELRDADPCAIGTLTLTDSSLQVSR